MDATIGGVVLNHPEVGEVLYDVAIGIDTPLLVGAAYPVHTQLGSDIGSIVKGLCHILQTAPHQHVERTWVLLACLTDYPLRTLRWFAIAAGRHLAGASLRHNARPTRRRARP